MTISFTALNALRGSGSSATATTAATHAHYRQHGRTTAIDDHSDFQVLKRIRRFLLPKDFAIQDCLLQEMVAGYDIGDPIADRLITEGALLRVTVLS